MKALNIFFFSIIFFTIFSCKKDKNMDDAKCFCIEFKNQKCLKYYQTVEEDPWGNSLLSNLDLEKVVEQFCDSLNIKVFKINIKETKDQSELIYPCTCSRTGKIIYIKVKSSDADKLKQYKFTDN